MATFAPKSFLDGLDSQDFNDVADGVIESVLPAVHEVRTQVQQAVQGAVEQASSALPSFSIPSLDALTSGWVDKAPGPTAPDQPDQSGTAQSGLPSYSIPSLASLTADWLPKPSPQSAAPGGAALAQPAAMPSASAPTAQTGQAPSAAPAAPLTRIDTSSRDANLQQWAPALQDVERRTGLRADALAAIIQAENGGGQSPLSAGDNNYFSITAVPGRPNQAGVGVGGRFAHYDTPQDSLNDFVDLVSKHYPEAWANRSDPAAFFQGLVKGGYIVPEAGFPVETWLKNLDDGRQYYNQNIAPKVQQTGAIPGPEQGPNGTPTVAQQASKTGAAPAADVDQQALDDPDKWALCGPVAAVIAAQTRGQNWTVAQAKQIAQAGNLWDANLGMHGLESEVQLLRKMNIAASTGAASQDHLAADAQAGNTPIISTNKHYFILKGYDPATGRFDTTTTGQVFKGGSRWLTLDQIANLGGGIQGAAYFDNPTSPTPSVVAGASPTSTASSDQSTSSTLGSPPSSATSGSSASAARPSTMYRQPLQATPGADTTPEDASVTPADASAPFPSPAPDLSPPSGAGAFQDDYTQNGYTQAGAGAGIADASGTAGYQSPAYGGQAVPAARTIPNEDATSYPRPDYVPPASPLVTAPAEQPSGSRFDPLAGQAPAAPGEINPTVAPAPSAAAPFNPLAGQPPAQPDELPQRPGSATPSLLPVWDAAQNVVGYVQAGAQAADASLNAPVAPPNSPQGRALQSVGIDPSLVGNPIAAAERTARDLPGRLAQLPRINQQAVDEAAQQIIDSARATGQAVSERDVLGAVWHGALTALSGVNAGVNVLGADINALAPDEGVGPVGPGDILTNANLPQDVLHLAQGAGRLLAAGRRVTPDVIASLRSGVADAGEGAASRELANALPSGEGDTSRFYHGTAGDFERADPGKFDPNGLYGPGYYVTSDPRVAGSYSEARSFEPGGVLDYDTLAQRVDFWKQELERYRAQGNYDAIDELTHDVANGEARLAEMSKKLKAGPNVRPLDVPNDLHLLNADKPPSIPQLQAIADAVPEDVRPIVEARLFGNPERTVRGYDYTGDEVHKFIARALGDGRTPASAAAVNDVLQRAGFDGIQHTGGQIRALLDANGQPIEHEVRVIFPNALDRVRQAYSGDYGGALPSDAQRSVGPAYTAALGAAPGRAIAGGLTGAVTGGAAGYESSPEGATPGETAARTLAGAGAGALVGRTIGGAGTLAAGRAIDSLVERGALNPRLLATHPEMDDRIRAMFALAAEGKPDGAVVETPAMASAMLRVRPQLASRVADLVDGPVTAGQVRQIVGAADSPGVASTVQGMLIDALTGLGAGARRGRETAADAATVRGLSSEAQAATRGRAPSTAPTLAYKDGEARLVTPEQAPNLTGFVNEVADKLGVERPGVYVAPSSVANAAATTDGKAPALIITRGLLGAGLTDDEMAAVLTHELAHTAQDSRSPVARAFGAARDALGNLTGGGTRDLQGALSAAPEGERPPHTGNLTQAFGEKPGERVQFRFRVAPLEDLVTSHTNSLGVNPDFPAELQPRVRERAASRQQIDSIMQHFDPDQLLVDTHTVDRGPMIVGPDNVVESGNGRSIALRRLAEEDPKAYQRYVDGLRESLPDYGLTPDDLKGIRNPVLVRERVTDLDRARFAASANVGAQAEMAPIERAFQDAGRLADEHVANLTVGEGQSIDQALLAPANVGTVRAFMTAVPESERGALLDAQGNLNAYGLERLKSALLAKTYTGEAGARISTAFVESTDPGVRNVENAIYASLPAVARSEAQIAAGSRDVGLSIAPDVAAAVDVYARLKRAGMSVPDYLAQAPLFGERETTPAQDRILRFLDDNARSPRRIRAMLEGYANAVDNQADAAQVGMFGEASRASKEEVLDGVTRELGAAPTDASADLGGIGAGGQELAGAPEGPAAAPEPRASTAPLPAAESPRPAPGPPPSAAVRPRSPAADILPRGGPEGTLAREGAPEPLARPGPLPDQPAPTTGGPEGTLAQPGAPTPLTRPSSVAPVSPGAVPATGGPAGELARPGAPDPLRNPAGPETPSYDPARALPPPIQQAVEQAQAQAKPGVPPLTWLRRFAGSVSYSSLIGPTAGVAKTTGDLANLAWALPKETARAFARGAPAEAGQILPGIARGWQNVGDALVQTLRGQGQYNHAGSLAADTANPVGKLIATIPELGGRLVMGAPTAFFGSLANGMGEQLAAARAATDAVKAGRIAERDRLPFMQAILKDADAVKAGELPSLPATRSVIDEGDAYAKQQTFQQPLGPWGQSVKGFLTASVVPVKDGEGKVIGSKPLPILGNLLTPIFNVPWNLKRALVERSPLGAVGVASDLARGKGTTFDKAYDAIVGSALTVGLMGLATQGRVTGNGPADPQQRQELLDQGWRPYSMLVNGTYISTRYAAVWAPALNLAGDLHDAIAYQKPKAGAAGVSLDVLSRFGSQLRQEAFLQPLADTLSLVDPTTPAGAESRLAKYGAGVADRMVPYASWGRVLGTAQDPNARTTDRGSAPFVDQFTERARLGAGNRQGFAALGQAPLPAAQDALGRPVENQQQGAGALVSSLGYPKPDPILYAFQGSGVDIPGPHQYLTVNTGRGQGSVQIPFTPDESRQWNSLRGASVQRQMGPIMQSPNWPKAGPAERQVVLKEVLRQAGQDADAQIQSRIGVETLRRRLGDATAQKAS